VKGKIRFEKGVENDVYKYEIDKVWVQFRGLPKEFREFPIIWAIGSILSVPRAVDTKFTKKFGRSRMKVAVLDPNLIPDLVDVVIGVLFMSYNLGLKKTCPMVSPKSLIWTLPWRMRNLMRKTLVRKTPMRKRGREHGCGWKTRGGPDR
jgi:hypothetical protein